MDFNAARKIGDEGELEVSKRLRSLMSAYSFGTMDKVLLKRGRITAECDHVVVDRFGVLIIETKVRRGARIRGTSTDKKWTAVYQGKTATFANPLLQNMQHLGVLRNVLKDAGIVLTPDQVSNAVVFIGADLSYLELDARDKLRVTRLEDDLSSLFEARRDFGPNAGDLSPEKVQQIFASIVASNHAGQVDAEAQHARYRGGAVAATPGPSPGEKKVADHPPSGRVPVSFPTSHPAPVAQLSGRHYVDEVSGKGQSVRIPLLIALGILGAALAVGAIVYGLSRMTPLAWLVVLVVVAGAFDTARPKRARGSRTNASRSAESASIGSELGRGAARIVVAALFLLGMWVFIMSGAADAVIRGIASGVAGSSAPTSAVDGVGTPKPDVSMAKRQLKESNKKMYAAATDLDTPTIADGPDDSISYTWHYLKRVDPGAVRVLEYTLTIDPSGHLVGVHSSE